MSWFSRKEKVTPEVAESTPVVEPTEPVDLAEWRRWEKQASGHDMSPRLRTRDGRIQRRCHCGWVGPICETAQEARDAHQIHAGFGPI